MNIILILTIALMIASIVFAKTISIFKQTVGLYWIVALLGSVLLLTFDSDLLPSFLSLLLEDSNMNPIKILVLFLAFTTVSIYLDEIGVIAYLASQTAAIAGQDQKKLFFYFYVLVSFLTVFTANDIVILTLTPFIIYFSKNAKINPLPFVIMQFVAANTWSMLFIIGNPTNIYIATSFGIHFIDYFLVMSLPTIMTGLLSYGLLRFLFIKSLSQPMVYQGSSLKPERSFAMLGVIHLIGVTLCMAIAPYVGLEMYGVALIFSLSLCLSHVFLTIFQRTRNRYLIRTLVRLPWSLVPFFLSMVVMIQAFDQVGWVTWFIDILIQFNQDWIYGLASFFVANVINNIPMSILFSNMLAIQPGIASLEAIYASIIGSNLGAILTPIGALAGMMWMTILNRFNIRLHFYDFFRYGLLIGFPLLALSLFTLQFIV